MINVTNNNNIFYITIEELLSYLNLYFQLMDEYIFIGPEC